MNADLLKIGTYKLFVYKSTIFLYMYKQYLALNNQQGLIQKPTNQQIISLGKQARL